MATYMANIYIIQPQVILKSGMFSQNCLIHYHAFLLLASVCQVLRERCYRVYLIHLKVYKVSIVIIIHI